MTRVYRIYVHNTCIGKVRAFDEDEAIFAYCRDQGYDSINELANEHYCKADEVEIKRCEDDEDNPWWKA